MFDFNIFVFLTINILNMLVIYKYFDYLFAFKRFKKKYLYIIYLMFFVETSLIYFCFNIIAINIINSILWHSLIALCYRPIKKSLIMTLIYLIILALSETIVACILGIFTKTSYGVIADASFYPALGNLLSQLLGTLIVIAIAPKLKKQDDGNIPVSYWLAVAFVPVASAYLLNYFYTISENVERLYFDNLLPIIAIIGINIIIFYAYDKILDFYTIKLTNQTLNMKIDAYNYQNMLILESYNTVRETKHNLNNILATVQMQLKNNDYKRAYKQIHELIGEIDSKNTISNSGNTLIDGMINYKAKSAEIKGIQINTNIQLLDISGVIVDNICIILGVAMDNAIEACEKDADKKFVDISILAQQGIIIISIKNPLMHPLVLDKKGKILSSKTDNGEHGLGLKSIEKLAEKHNGNMNIDANDNVFSLEVILYYN